MLEHYTRCTWHTSNSSKDENDAAAIDREHYMGYGQELLVGWSWSKDKLGLWRGHHGGRTGWLVARESTKERKRSKDESPSNIGMLQRTVAWTIRKRVTAVVIRLYVIAVTVVVAESSVDSLSQSRWWLFGWSVRPWANRRTASHKAPRDAAAHAEPIVHANIPTNVAWPQQASYH